MLMTPKKHLKLSSDLCLKVVDLLITRYSPLNGPRILSGFVPITLTIPVGFEPATSSSAFPAYSAISEITIILLSSRHPSLQDNPSAVLGIAHRPSASRART